MLVKALADRGLHRLSVDEEVFARHGRYGIDHLHDTYFDSGPHHRQNGMAWLSVNASRSVVGAGRWW